MNNVICQFYVIIGDKNFKSPIDNNVYINATDINDFKIIQDEIFKTYKEKAKLGIKVGSEIIFLVSGINDSKKANDVIKALRLNGKIEVIKKEVSETKIPEINDIKVNNWLLDEEKTNDIEEASIEVEEETVKEETVKEETVKEEKITVTKHADNIYKRDFDSNNYNGYIGKPALKKDKFSKLPIIIFIISLLLFISSIILLFVL